jgi:hypothetical protein
MHKSKIDGVKTFFRQQFDKASAKPAEEGRPKMSKRDAFAGLFAEQFSSGAKPRTSSGDAPPRREGGIKAFLHRPAKGFSNAEVSGGASEGAVPHDQSTAASARAPEGAAPSSTHQAQQAHHARQVQAHTSYTNAYTQLNDLKNQSQHIQQQLAPLVKMGAISPEKAQQLKDNIIAGFGVINQDMSSAAEHLKSNPDFASRALSSAGVNAGTLRNQIRLANTEIAQAQQNKFSEVKDNYTQLHTKTSEIGTRINALRTSGTITPEQAAKLSGLGSIDQGLRNIYASMKQVETDPVNAGDTLAHTSEEIKSLKFNIDQVLGVLGKIEAKKAGSNKPGMNKPGMDPTQNVKRPSTGASNLAMLKFDIDTSKSDVSRSDNVKMLAVEFKSKCSAEGIKELTALVRACQLQGANDGSMDDNIKAFHAKIASLGLNIQVQRPPADGGDGAFDMKKQAERVTVMMALAKAGKA